MIFQKKGLNVITEVDTELELMEVPEEFLAEADSDGGDSSASDLPEESELSGLLLKRTSDLDGRDLEIA